ncbi:MAG: SRPBCC family protein [Winogradskyella arenosi]
MKALKYILLLVLILVIGLSIYVAVQPNSFEVSRTRTISAPHEVVYDNVIDFKNWSAWSAWIEENPDINIVLGEQTQGVGGSYKWNADGEQGRMETTAANPKQSITQELQFGTYPTSDVHWEFKPNDDGTTDVTWRISGKDLPFGFKMYMAFSGGMDKQIGPDYERGLEKLDSVVQAEMKVYSIQVEGLTQHSGGYYLYNTTSCKLSDFEANMKTTLGQVGSYALTHNISRAGQPFIYYHKWDEDNNAVIFSACIPTNSRVISEAPHILTGQLESFKTVKTVLTGDYSHLKAAWEATMTYIKEQNLELDESGPMLETYLTSPDTHPNPAHWKTEIYVAVK